MPSWSAVPECRGGAADQLTDAVDLGWCRWDLLVASIDGVELSSCVSSKNRAERTGTGNACRAVALSSHFGSDCLDRQHSSSLLGQLGSRLRVWVEQREVGHYDGHGQSDGEHSEHCAAWSDQHSEVGLRCEVAIANGGHGDDGPPQASWNGHEIVVRVVLRTLGVVDERGEDNDAKNEEIDEQEQLVCARFERMKQNLSQLHMRSAITSLSVSAYTEAYSYGDLYLIVAGVLCTHSLSGRSGSQWEVVLEKAPKIAIDSIHGRTRPTK